MWQALGQLGACTALVESTKTWWSLCLAARSNRPICRSVPTTRNTPSRYSMSLGEVSSASAARPWAFSTVRSDATLMAEPPTKIEREPALPKPVPRSVSPCTMRTFSIGTPNTSTTSCA